MAVVSGDTSTNADDAKKKKAEDKGSDTSTSVALLADTKKDLPASPEKPPSQSGSQNTKEQEASRAAELLADAVTKKDKSPDGGVKDAYSLLKSEFDKYAEDKSHSGPEVKTYWETLSNKLSKNGVLNDLELSTGEKAISPETLLKDAKATVAPARSLDDKTLTQAAQELHDAVNKKAGVWVFEHNKPDKETISRILEPLGQEDRKRLEEIYASKYGKDGSPADLRNELKDKLGGENSVDFRKAEAQLNRADGRTNDAGALFIAIMDANKDKEKGNTEIRNVLETLNSKQITQLDEDFKKAYGMSYKDALSKANLSDATKDALPILEKGVENKTKEDIVKLATIAVDRSDPHLFSEALRGDSDAAKAARKELNSNEEFKNRVAEAFKNPDYQEGLVDKDAGFEQKVDKAARDYLQEGRISLATITNENTGKWIFNNEENVSLAVKNATQAERDQYIRGHDLAAKDPSTLAGQEKDDFDYYNKVHKTFTDGGSPKQVAIWEDQLVNGKDTLISSLAQTHDDGWGPFSWGKSTKMNDAITQVENMGADDYKRLQDPKYYAQFKDSLRKYSADGEYNRIMDMVDKKLAVGDFSKSQEIHRSLTEDISDNKSSKFLGMGTSLNGKNILENIEHLSSEDAKKYQTDQEFRKSIDTLVDKHLSDDEKTLAHRLLDQAAKTGNPPDLKNDLEAKFLHDKIHGADSQTLVSDAQAMLGADPALRQRLAADFRSLSPADRILKYDIEAALSQAYYKNTPQPADGSYGMDNPYAEQRIQAISDELFKNASLSLQSEFDLNFPKDQIIADAAKASDSEREQIRSQLSPGEQQVLAAVTSNANHEMTTADKMRLFVINSAANPADFKAELEKLHQANDFESIQKLKDEYNKKYGSDLGNDFLKKVPEGERGLYGNLLTPANGDGRQTFYDNLHKYLGENGVVNDGSGLTMQRSIDQTAATLEEYQRVYKTLPLDTQRALDKYFNDSLEQYKSSKEKLSEIASTALITAAALAVIVASGGTATPLVLAAAFVAGGVAKNLIAKGIEGEDFQMTAENIAKKFLSGGVTAAANFFGGEALGFGKTLATIGNTVAADALVGVGALAVKQGGKEIIANSLPALLARGAGKLSEADMAALVESVASPAATQAEKALLKQSIEASVSRQTAAIDGLVNGSQFQKVITGALESGATGAVVNAGTTAIDQVLNGQPLNVKDILASGLTGFALGSTIHLGFTGLKGASEFFAVSKTPGLNGAEPHLYAAPEHGKVEYVQRGNDVYKIDGSKGEHLKLQDGDIPLRQAPPEGKFRKLPSEEYALELAGPADVSKSAGLDRPNIKIEGKEIEPGKSYVIGRQSAGKGDLLIDDPTVSGRHAAIRTDKDGNRYITDLQSTNGTYVNGKRLLPNVETKIGPLDSISLGPHKLGITEIPAPELRIRLGLSNIELKPGQEIPVGRGKDGISNQVVSSQHCRIGRDESGYYLIDESRNGTFVTRDGNDIRIPQGERFYLRPSDEVGLGNPVSRGGELLKLGRDLVAEVPKLGPVTGGIPEKALKQSNDYGRYHELKDRIEDGWSTAGRDTKFELDGSFDAYGRPAMVVDRQSDPVLRAALDEAKTRFSNLPPRERAVALTKWAKEKLTRLACQKKP